MLLYLADFAKEIMKGKNKLVMKSPVLTYLHMFLISKAI